MVLCKTNRQTNILQHNIVLFLSMKLHCTIFPLTCTQWTTPISAPKLPLRFLPYFILQSRPNMVYSVSQESQAPLQTTKVNRAAVHSRGYGSVLAEKGSQLLKKPSPPYPPSSEELLCKNCKEARKMMLSSGLH